MTTITTSL